MTGPELRSVALDESPDATGSEHAPAPAAPAEGYPRGGRVSWPQVRATVSRWVSASWWWGIVPLLRAAVSSSSWSHLVERAAPVLCGGLVQLTALFGLVLGTALLCWPSAAATAVGCVLLAAGVVLGLYRSWLGAGVGAALGAGLLFLPGLAAVAAGGVLAVLGAVVLAAPVARLAYPHSVRGRVRSGFGSTGWAGWWDRHRHLSAHAVRAAAVATRPSVAAEVTPNDPMLDLPALPDEDEPYIEHDDDDVVDAEVVE